MCWYWPPHADDEVLGCGGAISRHVQAGDRVIVAVLTNASVGAPELYSSQYVDVARAEAREAHARLDVAEAVFEDLPAPMLDQFPIYRLANLIAGLLTRFSPATLYVPFRGDVHQDHEWIFKAAMVAARPQPAQVVQRVLAYETPSETEWAVAAADTQFSPNYFVGIEYHLKAKLEAFSCYRSQIKSFPHPRSLPGIEALARWRGASVGVPAAEAFWLVRSLDK